MPRASRRVDVDAVVRCKAWVEAGGAYLFGHGVAAILDAISRTGSFRGAAARLGKSYRYVWGRVRELEVRLGRPLVRSVVGGRAARRTELTPLGRDLTRAFLAYRRRLLKVAERAGRGVLEALNARRGA